MTLKLEKIKNFLEKYKDSAIFCKMCPRNCKIDRRIRTGNCGEPLNPRVASINLHFGEEPPVSGSKGSGTVFFSGCNLHCIFCQNFPISQLHQANQDLSIEQLSQKLLDLQARGAHNINFVSPSHYIYQIVQSLKKAVERGLTIPVLFNTGGYDHADILRDLEGIVDLWLPDAKYAFEDLALRYSGARDYVEVNRKALLEIYRQTSEQLVVDSTGMAKKGIIIRHLVLPGQTENSIRVLDWIKKEMGNQIHLSLMSQYFPTYKALEKSPDSLGRKLHFDEYNTVVHHAEDLGFENGWFQESETELP